MAHNIHIDEKTQEAAMFSLKEIPWHGLGQIVEEAKNSSEVIKLAHLDYQIEKVPNFIKIGDQDIESGSFSVIRTDTNAILGNQLLKGYTVLQNEEIFSFMNSLVLKEKDITYHTAGALGDGEIVFVTAKLPGYLRIAGTDDIIEKYVLVTTAHNGSMPIIAQLTDIRVVCNNTLTAALCNADNRVYLRHTANISSRLEESRKIMNLELTFSKTLEEVLNVMNKIIVRSKEVKEVMNHIFLTPAERILSEAGGLSTRKLNTLQQIEHAIEAAPGQNMHRGTGLWLYNGITSYLQNVKEYRSEDRKMKGVMISGGEEMLISQKAMDSVLALG